MSSALIKGNIARISDIREYDDGGTKTLYVTVIDNHQRSDGNGGYIDAGKTVYDVSFRNGMADRVHQSFAVGHTVLIEAEAVRASLTTANGETNPVMKARGIDIGRSPRYAAFR
ncbi:hypothetical protein [Nocardia yamanashiensis]|uniref:hypothetical protein n=1 Tax=Nocardia yamanashiensis TaxID=209247 RepID=UPI000833DDC6|nr:hypothetical protein [Nocardia yamanashiensis]